MNMKILSTLEYRHLKKKLGREPNILEQHIVNAEWSEHCSYKSSKKFLRLLPVKGDRVIIGPGLDAGVLDVGEGYVITIHIESHNHPSAVEPYGGAATGVGGVIRDIFSMGTRPIALFNALRFGTIDSNKSLFTSKNRWLLKNVVKGISDYGNCMGVPTVGGELQFDDSFNNYTLVDVACIGHGKLSHIVKNTAEIDDLVILAGNTTGKDGIHGASFASKSLDDEENRSAIQIPDPFLEKILLEATLEALQTDCIKSIKDLGGGGLSCCLSETADSLQKGFIIDLSDVKVKEKDMTVEQMMISESQERMMFIVSKDKINLFSKVFDKYDISYSIIGKVTDNNNLVINRNGICIANMPAAVVAHAPLLTRKFKKPAYLRKLSLQYDDNPTYMDICKSIEKLLSDPNLCSRKWIYQQFDHEVGTRTVHKPGFSDSAVLKLDNNKYLTFKLDGNSKHCYLNPYKGTIGCLSESLRNTICVGATPIGIVDHLQFGSPENQEIFWTFIQSINAIKDFCKFMKLPVVGGKVSLYNETNQGAIKPSPVIGTVGIIDNKDLIKYPIYKKNEVLFIIGITKEELGGSEYFEHCLKIIGGSVPSVSLKEQKKIITVIQELLKHNMISGIHDCSKGGIAITLIEMAIKSGLGFIINLDHIPNTCKRSDYLLFSESHNRFIFSSSKEEEVVEYLSKKQVPYSKIGFVTNEDYCIFEHNNNKIIYKQSLSDIAYIYENKLRNILENK